MPKMTINSHCHRLPAHINLLLLLTPQKYIFSMKSVKNYLFLALITIAVLSTGCKKDDNDNGGNGTYKVKFIGTVSPGSTITSAYIIYGINTTSYTALSGTTWTKEIEISETDARAFADNPTKNIAFGVQADGRDANATAKVEIIVNGSSVKTAEGKGTVLSPTANYIFN